MEKYEGEKICIIRSFSFFWFWLLTSDTVVAMDDVHFDTQLS